MVDSNTQDSKDSKKTTEARKARVPMGIPRSKLSAPDIPGYVLRWFNNRNGRIEAAELGGWQFVTYTELAGQAIGQTNVRPTTDEMGQNITALVGTDDRGSEMRSYLMKIEKDLYDEDQAVKAANIDMQEQGITTLPGVGSEHQYGAENTRIGSR